MTEELHDDAFDDGPPFSDCDVADVCPKINDCEECDDIGWYLKMKSVKGGVARAQDGETGENKTPK